MVKLRLFDAQEVIEIAAIDFKLQHGVTVRPIEIVRRIEGPLRTLPESGAGGRQERPARGRGPTRETRNAMPPVEAPKPAPAPQAEQPAAEGDAQRKRRRRRRRGRGGGGGGAPGGGEAPAGE
jgi:hypothetical protein